MSTKQLDFSILVIGRRNHARKSHGIEKFILEASRHANEVIYLASEKEKYAIDKERYAVQINSAISCAFNHAPKILSPISVIILRKTMTTKLARRLTQFIYLSFHPKIFASVVVSIVTGIIFVKKNPIQQVEALVKRMKGKRVIIISHSAGGILAAQTQHLEKIGACICFGYPFKHPKKDEEAYRTAPLRSIKKPFLIFQGTDDEYGSALKASDYLFSKSVICIPITANHDYEKIEDPDFEKMLAGFSSLLV